MRCGNVAGKDQYAIGNYDQGQRAKPGQQKGHCAVEFGLSDDLPAALGVDLGKRFEVLVEGNPHRAIGVIVTPFAPRGGADLDPASNQFPTKLNELLDAFLEDGELFGIVGLDDSLP